MTRHFLFIGMALLIVLLGVNLALIKKNRALEDQVRTLSLRDATPAGTLLPALAGETLDGRHRVIDPEHSAPFVLMAFSPECRLCDQNWPKWQDIMSDPKISHLTLLVSANKRVPESYLAQYGAARHPAIVGLDQVVAQELKLDSTPQTIFIRKGRVEHTWPGVLSADDVREVKRALLDVVGN